jgi:hypothetical protein
VRGLIVRRGSQILRGRWKGIEREFQPGLRCEEGRMELGSVEWKQFG